MPAARSSSWRRISSPCERVLHPVDQRQLVGEVGDDRAGVRQPVQAEEGGAALEVDQHEVERSPSECVTASASTSVRSSSLLPEPVAPMSRPCGPMPSWADSLRSSSTGLPSGRDADRHPQPVAVAAAAPRRAPGRARTGRRAPAARSAPWSAPSGCSPRRRRRQPQRARAGGPAPRPAARPQPSARPTVGSCRRACALVSVAVRRRSSSTSVDAVEDAAAAAW